MRFTFRADASSTIGFGHLSRAVALAGAAIRAGASVTLVAARPDVAVRAFAERAGVELHAIDAAPGSAEDARVSAGVAGAGSFIVVDGYAFHHEYLGLLGGDDRIVTYVDDLARERFDCDVVVNPNVSGARASYVTGPRTVLLVGASFAIVSDRFVGARNARIAERRSEPPVAARLLVTMGGSDPPGATLRVVESLARLEAPPLHVRVIVGAANPRRADIHAAASTSTRHRFELRGPVEDMAAEMRWADIAITASGVTASELACVGVPGITFAIADNQEPIAAELARLGLFRVLPPDGAGSVAMTNALVQLAADAEGRTRMVEAQRRTIDGEGKDRVVSRLIALRATERHTRDREGGDRG